MAGWQFHPLLSIFQLGIIVSFGVALYSVRYMRHNGTNLLVGAVGLLAFNNGVWVLAATLKTARTDLASKLFFYQFEFFGYWGNPAVALVLALAYVGHERWLSRRTVGALAAIPLVGIALVILNPGDVMIVDPVLVQTGSYAALEHSFPLLNRLFTLWATVTMLTAGLVVAVAALRGRVLRKPALLVVLTFLVPLFVSTLKSVGVYPPGGDGVNPTPAFGSVALVLLAVAVFEYRLLELVPVGRDRAVDVMDDGYVLVGADGEILDANDRARVLLAGDPAATIRGTAVAGYLPDGVDLASVVGTTVTVDGRDLQATCSAVVGRNGAEGKVLVLRDLTELKERERELERHERIMVNLPVAVAQVRPEDQSGFDYVNEAVVEMFGFDSKAAAREHSDRELYADPTDREPLTEAIRATGRVDDREVEYETVDGRRFWGSVTASAETIDGETSIIAVIQDITERKEYEQRLEAALETVQSERDGKEAIRQLLLESSTDQQLLDSVCQLLVEGYDYEAAWVVQDRSVDATAETGVVTVASHGNDRGFREAVDGGSWPTGPTRRALDDAAPVTVTASESTAGEGTADIDPGADGSTADGGATDTDAAADGVSDWLTHRGLAAVRSIPLEHGGLTHGALTVLRREPETSFTETLVAELAAAIAFKQQVSQQQDALVADAVVEVDVRIGDGAHVLCRLAAACGDGPLEAHELRTGGDGRATVLLGTAATDADRLADAATGVEGIHDPTVVADDEETVVRAAVATPTLGTVLGRFGGVVQSVTATDRHVDATVQFPRRTDVGAVVDAVRETWPDATLRSRRALTVGDEQPAVFETLTEKQEQALRAAYLTGFFERPQEATADEVAETIGVSRSTFLHHLRNAERKVFAEAFTAPQADRPTREFRHTTD